MDNDLDDLGYIPIHPTIVVQRIAANLMQQISHVLHCVADCAMTLNKVLEFDENNQQVVGNKLDYLWVFVPDIGTYCQTNFHSTGVDLANLCQSFKV